jgi:hypothetical protein
MGAARVATRQGLQAKSFDLAAEGYQEAVGGSMSSDSLRGITIGWGQQVEERRVSESKLAFAATGHGERADLAVVEVVDPLTRQANLSSDEGMILVREEGWKEVKLTVISEVCQPEPEKPTLVLQRHSYQAGLWDADTMGQHQYLEGLRRNLDACRLSSANDGAPWIDRITTTNFPQAVQILDWGYADERIWRVAKAAFGEGTTRAKQWAETPFLSILSFHGIKKYPAVLVMQHNRF